ncbi:MAG: hypothetical protein ACXAC7_21510 [Candidatus Hodarchaeales archaeon]
MCVPKTGLIRYGCQRGSKNNVKNQLEQIMCYTEQTGDICDRGSRKRSGRRHPVNNTIVSYCSGYIKWLQT